MDDDKYKEVYKRIISLHLDRNTTMYLMILIRDTNLSDKKIKTFMNMKSKKVATGFLYRFVISNAYKYGVPKVYIKKCLLIKSSYEHSLKYENVHFESNNLYGGTLSRKELKRAERKKAYTELLLATLEMVKIKNSRKAKLERVLEKIADKNS